MAPACSSLRGPGLLPSSSSSSSCTSVVARDALGPAPCPRKLSWGEGAAGEQTTPATPSPPWNHPGHPHGAPISSGCPGGCSPPASQNGTPHPFPAGIPDLLSLFNPIQAAQNPKQRLAPCGAPRSARPRPLGPSWHQERVRQGQHWGIWGSPPHLVPQGWVPQHPGCHGEGGRVVSRLTPPRSFLRNQQGVGQRAVPVSSPGRTSSALCCSCPLPPAWGHPRGHRRVLRDHPPAPWPLQVALIRATLGLPWDLAKVVVPAANPGRATGISEGSPRG